MRRHRRPATLVIAVSLTAAALLGACGSDAAPEPADRAAQRKANEAFLIERANFKADQARCVSQHVSVDLERLLSKGSGDSDLTKKAGYDEFATAVRACVREDERLTTTTTR